MEIEYRKCKNCEGKVIGRSDKKFCSDACKSNYHYVHNPKKKAFRSFCENEKEIKNGFKNLKETVQTDLEGIRERKLLVDKDTGGDDISIEYELLKSHTILSQIKKIEGLLFS